LNTERENIPGERGYTLAAAAAAEPAKLAPKIRWWMVNAMMIDEHGSTE